MWVYWSDWPHCSLSPNGSGNKLSIHVGMCKCWGICTAHGSMSYKCCRIATLDDVGQIAVIVLGPHDERMRLDGGCCQTVR